MNKNMREGIGKILSYGLITGLIASSLAGCGKASDDNQAQNGADPVEEIARVDYDAIYRESETVNVINETWICDSEVTAPDYYMSVDEYDSSVYEDHESVVPYYRGSRVDGNNLYTMRVYFIEEESQDGSGETIYCPAYYLDILDTDSLEVSTVQYDDDMYLYSIAVSNGRIVSYEDDRDDDGYVNSCNLVEIMLDGSMEIRGNFYPVIEQAGLLPEAYYAIDSDIYFNAYSEEVYLISSDQSCIYISDLDASNVECCEGVTDDSETITYLCNTYEGIPLFWSYDSIAKKSKVFWLENREPRILFETDSMNIYHDSSIDSKGNLIYMTGYSILSWNIKSGKEERLIIGNSNVFSYVSGLARNSNGEVIVVNCDENTLRRYTFSGPAQSVTIEVDGISIIGYEARQFFAEYENTHPGVKFNIPSDSDLQNTDPNIRGNQIFTDIANGAGPDIVFMYNEIYRDYADTGCLMDLSDIFTEEKRKEILPQILELGCIDDKQYAVYFDYDMGLLVTNKDTWSKNTWNVGDVLTLIEDRKKAGNPFEYLGIYGYGFVEYPLSFFTRDIDNSGWIDYVNGTCNFDNEEFRKVLEVCKEYNSTWGQSMNSGEIQQALKDGRVLYMIDSGSLVGFSEIMADSNGEDVVVGWPTTTGNGTVIMGGTAMVVNKNTEHYDIIKDFIDCVYSYDYMGQSAWSIPYSLNLYDDKIHTPNMPGHEWCDSPVIELDSHTSRPIKGKPDGESYLPEYKEVLANARVLQWQQDDINTIIFEEADRYFNSDSISVDEIVNCIQSRVSLYMAENY